MSAPRRFCLGEHAAWWTNMLCFIVASYSQLYQAHHPLLHLQCLTAGLLICQQSLALVQLSRQVFQAQLQGLLVVHCRLQLTWRQHRFTAGQQYMGRAGLGGKSRGKKHIAYAVKHQPCLTDAEWEQQTMQYLLMASMPLEVWCWLPSLTLQCGAQLIQLFQLLFVVGGPGGCCSSLQLQALLLV